MKEISEASLKKAILAVEAERLKNPSAFLPDRAQRATLRKSRRELDKMVSGFLRDAGFSIKRFQDLQQQRSVELERMSPGTRPMPSGARRGRNMCFRRESCSKPRHWRILARERIFFPIRRSFWIRRFSSGASRSRACPRPPCRSVAGLSSNLRPHSPAAPKSSVSIFIGSIPTATMLLSTRPAPWPQPVTSKPMRPGPLA